MAAILNQVNSKCYSVENVQYIQYLSSSCNILTTDIKNITFHLRLSAVGFESYGTLKIHYRYDLNTQQIHLSRQKIDTD